MSCILGCLPFKLASSNQNKEKSITSSFVSKVSTPVISRVSDVSHFALESLNAFWFVPFGAVLFIMAGRHWIPLNGLIFGGTTLASLITFSTLPQKEPAATKKTGALIFNAAVILAATTLFGIACNLFRGRMPKVFNIAAPIGIGLTGLLTGHALVRFAIQSVKDKPSTAVVVKKLCSPSVEERQEAVTNVRAIIETEPHGAPSAIHAVAPNDDEQNIIIPNVSGGNLRLKPSALGEDLENNEYEPVPDDLD